MRVVCIKGFDGNEFQRSGYNGPLPEVDKVYTVVETARTVFGTFHKLEGFTPKFGFRVEHFREVDDTDDALLSEISEALKAPVPVKTFEPELV